MADCPHDNLLPLLPSVSPAAPEVFVAHAEAGDVILEVLLLLGGVDAGQVHPVVPAVLLCLVPVGLKIYYLVFIADNSKSP